MKCGLSATISASRGATLKISATKRISSGFCRSSEKNRPPARKDERKRSKTAKADLVAALKASFDECDKAYDSLTDANASEMIKGPRGSRTKLGMLEGNITHDNEEYGYLAVYMRLKGQVPPSSDRAK